MLGRGPHVRVEGKGRKRRAVPLTSETVALLGSWLDDKSGERRTTSFRAPRESAWVATPSASSS